MAVSQQSCRLRLSVMIAIALAAALPNSGLADTQPCGPQNPFLTKGQAEPDGHLGAFQQHLAGDCFFLGALMALAQDADGRSLVESAIARPLNPSKFEVAFPNQHDQSITVTSAELENYQLADASGRSKATLATGDPDVRILEIAADKLWKQQKIKPEGLWDDVSMTAFFMFSNSAQQLIWNKNKASSLAIEDIAKSERLPKGTIVESAVTSIEEAEAALRKLLASDTDGISMIWMDYKRYHALTIVAIDFQGRTFSYLNPLEGTEQNLKSADLDDLLQGMADGQYAVNYLEVPKTQDGPVADASSTRRYPPTAIPTPRQLEYQAWETGLFVHFGIRTFYEGHLDWDGKPMPADGFRPTDFDANNWIETAKQAGMNYAVLVCKHHDGFANWPSKFSKYTVAQTPWKDGKGDVVAEFVAACRKQKMKIGFYYSPAEWGTPIYKDEKAYDDHFINQVSELLANYGEVDMLWFDGSGSGDHKYDWKRIIGEIRRLQPNILIFSMGDPDYRWVGNESGIAELPNWNTVPASSVFQAIDSAKGKASEGVRWLPAECDCRMRWNNWFYSDQDEFTVKSVEQLMGLYYLSVGRGANLLINIGPDRRGLLPEKDRQRLLDFGEEIRHRFDKPLVKMADGKVTDTGWEYAKAPLAIDHVVLQEDLTKGEAIRSFAIRIQPWYAGPLMTVYKGENIGHKAICRFPLVMAHKVVVEISESDGPVRLKNIELHSVQARDRMRREKMAEAAASMN